MDKDIERLLKAIKRLDSKDRDQLMGLTSALERLQPDQRLIIRRYDYEAQAKRVADSEERQRRERNASERAA